MEKIKLNEKTKEYIWNLINFIGGYETWEDLGIEGIEAIKLMGNYDITSKSFKKALKDYFKEVRKEVLGEIK